MSVLRLIESRSQNRPRGARQGVDEVRCEKATGYPPVRIGEQGQPAAITSKRYHNGYRRQSTVPAEATVTFSRASDQIPWREGDGSYEASIGGLDSGSSLP